MSAATDIRPTGVRWRILAILLSFSFMSWFNRVSLQTAYVGQIRHEYGISEKSIGLLGTALLFA